MKILELPETQLVNIDQIARIGRTKDITCGNHKQTYIELSSGSFVYTDISISELEDKIYEANHRR